MNSNHGLCLSSVILSGLFCTIAMKETANNETCKLSNRQGLMQDKIIASHTYFGEHMDVNCSASLQTFKFV